MQRSSAILLTAAILLGSSTGRTAESPRLADGLPGRRVMVLGDSITQNGLYVSFVEYFLQKANPAANYDIVSVGLGSENTSGLTEPGHAGGRFPRPNVHERLGRALAAVKPQVVIACYGMNDGILMPINDERMSAFQQGVTKLVRDCRAAGAGVILVTPPVFDAKKKEAWTYDQTLAAFADWEVRHPPAGVAGVVDLHGFMAAALAERQAANPSFHFCGDQVHPGPLGHLVMAQAILKGLGVALPSGTAEELLAGAEADPMFKLVQQRRELRSKAWLDHIGYTRERTVAPGSGDISATEEKAAGIQQEINELKKTAPPAKP
jgi:lysophospholipase L1-like esterase